MSHVISDSESLEVLKSPVCLENFD